LGIALLATTSVHQSAMVTWALDPAVAAGLPTTVATQERAEFLCNALIVAPASALGALLWSRTSWWRWAAAALAISSAVELFQEVFLPHRTGSLVDVAANTLGAVLGVALVTGARHARRRREN